MVQWLEKWEIHNPATLRCHMPSSHAESTLTRVCKHNVFKVPYFKCAVFSLFPSSLTFWRCFFLVCFYLPFFNPLALSSPLLSLPSLPPFAFHVYFLLSFLFIIFSFSSLASGRRGRRVSYYSVLYTSSSSSRQTNTCTFSHTNTHTLSWGLKAGRLWLRLMVKLHRLLF